MERGRVSLTVTVSDAPVARLRSLCIRCVWWGQSDFAEPSPLSASGVTVLSWAVRCGAARLSRYFGDAAGLLVSFHDADSQALLGQTVVSLSGDLLEPWRSASATVDLGMGTALLQLHVQLGVTAPQGHAMVVQQNLAPLFHEYQVHMGAVTDCDKVHLIM